MERSIKRAERSMSKTYLPYDPDEQLLLPAALQEWLPPDHPGSFNWELYRILPFRPFHQDSSLAVLNPINFRSRVHIRGISFGGQRRP